MFLIQELKKWLTLSITVLKLKQKNTGVLIIIKKISRAPIYWTKWECRALYNNTNTHPHIGWENRHDCEKDM